jgi:hypothetical protein
MQTQVVHQRKATLPWIPMVLAALFVFATVAGVQLALRDRGTSAPVVSVVDNGTSPGVRNVGAHGAARIAAVEEPGVASQKAAMVEAGVTSLSGIATETPAFSGGPHPRTKFGGSEDGSGGGRDAALRATITRIEQAR